MIRLLRSMLYRMIKDKIIIVSLIVSLAMSLLLIFVGLIFEHLLNDQSLTTLGLVPYNSGEGLFLASLTLTNNYGLAIPIFASILICRDFSYGTIRNKIIAGYKRSDIYISSLLANIIFSVASLTIVVLFTTLCGTIIFGFGREFNKDVLLYLLSSFGVIVIILIAFQSINHFFCMSTRKTFLAIIISVLLLSVSSIFTVILNLVPLFQDIPFLSYLITPYTSNLVTSGIMATDEALKVFLATTISSIVVIVVSSIIGIVSLNKAEIK